MDFLDAADGSKTCSANGIRLHSFYSPEKEAERFADGIPCDFNPKYILITEPALSYCAPFLRRRFAHSVLCCTRFCADFSQTDNLWDKVFYSDSALGEALFSFMGDEGIASCLFASWKPSEKAFPKQSALAWNEIKAAVLKSRNVLCTRKHFAKRWAKNAVRLSLFAKNIYGIKSGTSPVVVCASGPSLFSSLEKIREYRDSFFLIAVSSALSPLVNAGIVPDLCVSTDGGFWAKMHLTFAEKKFHVPLAVPAEGACPGEAAANEKIVPLFYGDGIGDDILRGCGICGLRSQRNGTVSGTAAMLALSITSGNVFFCGLDLAPSKSFCHTQPNELEKTDSLCDGRLCTQETRLAPGGFTSRALDIYRSWFSAADFGGRLKRLSNHFDYKNTLGKIQDTDWEYFAERKETGIKPELYKQDIKPLCVCREEAVRRTIHEKIGSQEWISCALPSETVVLERSSGTQFEENAKQTIQSGMQNFYASLIKSVPDRGRI